MTRILFAAIALALTAGCCAIASRCATNAFLVASLEPAIQRNVTAACYDGGHMMYDEPSIRTQMTKDVAAFVKGAVSRPR